MTYAYTQNTLIIGVCIVCIYLSCTVGLEKYGVTVEKSLLKKMFGNKNFSDTVVPLNNWGLMSTKRSGVLRCIRCGEVQPRPNCKLSLKIAIRLQPKKFRCSRTQPREGPFFSFLTERDRFLVSFCVWKYNSDLHPISVLRAWATSFDHLLTGY